MTLSTCMTFTGIQTGLVSQQLSALQPPTGCFDWSSSSLALWLPMACYLLHLAAWRHRSGAGLKPQRCGLTRCWKKWETWAHFMASLQLSWWKQWMLTYFGGENDDSPVNSGLWYSKKNTRVIDPINELIAMWRPRCETYSESQSP